MTLPLANMFQILASLAAIAIVLGLVAYGFLHGIFRSVLVGMQALVSVIVALTFIPSLTEVLITIDTPPVYAFPVALVVLFPGTALGIHLVIKKYVPDNSIELLSIIDKVGGGFIGGVAGFVAAGGFLVSLSILPLPQDFQLQASDLRFDFGEPMLRTFARIIEPDGEKRDTLLSGDTWTVVRFDENQVPEGFPQPIPPDPQELPEGKAPAPFAPAPPNIWSEPYVDLNDNNQRDDAEAYLDIVKDGKFTKNALQAPPPFNDDRNRFVGLLERYNANHWWRWRVNQSTWEELYPPVDQVGSSEDTGESVKISTD